MKNLEIRACAYVILNDLVPEERADEFWTEFGNNCPITFGNANLTMCTARRTAMYIETLSFGDEKWAKKIASRLRKLSGVYVELEN
jgi:hypothetical protein